MANDPTKTSVKTGFPLAELLGDAKNAAKSIKSEMRDISKEAKLLSKSGGVLSADKQKRFQLLESKKAAYESELAIQKETKNQINKSGLVSKYELIPLLRRVVSDVKNKNFSTLSAMATKAALSKNKIVSKLGGGALKAGGFLSKILPNLPGMGKVITVALIGIIKTANILNQIEQERAAAKQIESDFTETIRKQLLDESFLNQYTIEQTQDFSNVWQNAESITNKTASNTERLFSSYYAKQRADRQKTIATTRLHALRFREKYGDKIADSMSAEGIRSAFGSDIDREYYLPRHNEIFGVRFLNAVGMYDYAGDILNMIAGNTTFEERQKQLWAETSFREKSFTSHELWQAAETQVMKKNPLYRALNSQRNLYFRAINDYEINLHQQWNKY